jgi:hypothetical protein
MPTPLLVAATLLLSAATQAQAYTWPNPQLDALESLRYDQFGYNTRGTIIFQGLTPCSKADRFDAVAGRSNAADWIRNVRTFRT